MSSGSESADDDFVNPEYWDHFYEVLSLAKSKDDDEHFDWYSANEILVEVVSSLATPSSKVLDVGCGTASHLGDLSKLGYEVSGCDFSETVIEKARQLAAEDGVNVDYRQV